MKDEIYYKEIFSRNLRKLLSERNVQQIDVANAIGVSRFTFNKWVIGVAIPRMSKVQALADYFGVPKSELLEENHEDENYYINDEAREYAEFLFHNPEYRVLFSAARDVSKEDLEFVKDLLDRFKRKDQ